MSDSEKEVAVKNFALMGAAGFVAPRHMNAIKENGSTLVGAMDPHDCVGKLDSYFPDAHFFTEVERFDRFLEKRRRGPKHEQIDFLSVCTPNYLHDAHVRMALRSGAQAICEKPLVINPWNLDALEELEDEYGGKVNTVLQLRLHPAVMALREAVQNEPPGMFHDVDLTYITRRGAWYHVSWKGQEERSGGLAMNIGIHFFDLLLWIFGRPLRTEVHANSPKKMSGVLQLERARVRWFLSIDSRDLPEECRRQGKFAYRSMTVDGSEIDLSASFTDLHTEVYRQTIAGNGFGISEARPAIELVYQLRQQHVVSPQEFFHPAAA